MTLGPRDAHLTLEYFIKNKGFLKKWEPKRCVHFYTMRGQRCVLSKDFGDMKVGRLFKVWLFKRGTKPEKVIGSVFLYNIIMGNFLSAQLGYRLDEDEVNKGYISEALKLLIEFAFKGLKLHRIEANIMPSNTGSLRVAEKLGFTVEGLGKNYLKIDGKWEDHVHMVLLNEKME